MRAWFAVLAIGCAAHRAHRPGRAMPSLAPFVACEVPVSPAPGALPLGAFLEPGFALPKTVGGWLHVHVEGAVTLDGWVPASARGIGFGPVRAPLFPHALRATTIVHAAPSLGAELVAVLAAGVVADFAGEPGEWSPVTAFINHVRVTGWIVVPQPRVQTFDFTDDVIEGDLVKPEGPRD